MKKHLFGLALAVLVPSFVWALGTLSIPNQFAGVTSNPPFANLDTNFTTIANYVNNREAATGTLANRPTAAFNGKLYLATDVNGGTAYLDNGSTWNQVGAGVTTTTVFGYLFGCVLSNDGVSPNTVLDIAACRAIDGGGSFVQAITTAWTKTTAAWVAGTGNGALDTGSVASNTWYHVWLISQASAASPDYLFSTSATAPTMPANYTLKRRIGSFKTATASTNILAFTQDGDYFRWSASIRDVNVTISATTIQTATLTVPLGVNVQALINIFVTTDAGGTVDVYVKDPAANDEQASGTVAPLVTLRVVGSSSGGIYVGGVRTNTSQQINWRSNNATTAPTFALATLGWIDRRGRDQ